MSVQSSPVRLEFEDGAEAETGFLTSMYMSYLASLVLTFEVKMCWVQLITVHKFGTVATSGTFATFATFVTFFNFPTAKVYISYLAALVYWFTGFLTCPIFQVLVLTIQVILCWVQLLLMLNLLLLLLIIVRPYQTIPDQTGQDQTRPVQASPVLVSPAAPFILSP